MDTFNLNTDDYSNSDIVQLLGLEDNYSLNDIDKSKQVLIEQIRNNDEINSDKLDKLIFFLDTITETLSNHLTNKKSLENNTNNSILKHGQNILINDLQDNSLLNQIKRNKIYKSINIDSKFRKNYNNTNSTNFDYLLAEKQNKITSITISDINIPLSYYSISESKQNNSILIITNTSDKFAFLITIPDGNYSDNFSSTTNIDTIETALTAAISNAKKGKIDQSSGEFVLSPHSEPLNMTYSINKSDGKSVFKNISNITNIKFNVKSNGCNYVNNNPQLTLGWLLGFRNIEYITSSELTSEGLCMINNQKYAYIGINDYQTNYIGNVLLTFNEDSIMDKSIITKINLFTQSQGNNYSDLNNLVLQTQLNRKREYFGPVDIQRFTISLYDEFGVILDLNNMDWSFTIILEQIY